MDPSPPFADFELEENNQSCAPFLERGAAGRMETRVELMGSEPWRDYEAVATHLLNEIAPHLGLAEVAGKQTVPGKSGTEWEIDAKGVREGRDGFVLIEVRHRSTSKLDQGQMAELAFRILDTGAESGIVVSPLGLQEGARRVADSEGIVEATLTADSTPQRYMLRFLNQLFAGVAEAATGTVQISYEVDRSDGSLDRG